MHQEQFYSRLYQLMMNKRTRETKLTVRSQFWWQQPEKCPELEKLISIHSNCTDEFHSHCQLQWSHSLGTLCCYMMVETLPRFSELLARDPSSDWRAGSTKLRA